MSAPSQSEEDSQSGDVRKRNFVKLDPTAVQCFHKACAENSISIVKIYIGEEGFLTSVYEGKQPIHTAIENKRYEVVELLIESNCDVECEDEHKHKPIYYACLNGDGKILELLIKNKCNIESETEDKNRPIHLACEKGHIEIVKILLKENCSLNCKNENNETPLEVATKKGYIDCVKLIESFIKTKIVECIRGNDETEFSQLYQEIISSTDRVYYELSLLDIAHLNRADKIYKYLMNKTLDDEELIYLTNVYSKIKNLDANTLLGEVTLHRSIRDHHLKGFYTFCKAEIINGQHQLINEPFLSTAAKFGCHIFVHELLRKSIYNQETWDLAINEARESGNMDIAEDITDRGLMIASRLERCFSLLHTAVCDNDADMVGFLLEKNIVDANINHKIFGTALALAHSLSYKKCIDVFCKFNVDTNAQNQFMQTSLHESIISGTVDQWQYMIERYKNIDTKGFNNLTPLHCAVMEGYPDLCEQLVLNGASCKEISESLSTLAAEDVSLVHMYKPSVAKTVQSREMEKLTQTKSPPNLTYKIAENDQKNGYNEKFKFHIETFKEDKNKTITIKGEKISAQDILEVIENVKKGVEINVFERCKTLKRYLELLIEHAEDSPDAGDLSLICLYTLYRINNKSIDFRFPTKLFKTYFDGDFSMEKKLAAVVAYCYYGELNYEELEGIIMFLFDVLTYFSQNDEQKIHFEFIISEIKDCINTRIAMVINLLIMDKDTILCSSTYKILKVIFDNIDLCQDILIFPLMSTVSAYIHRDYKVVIIEKIQNEKTLDEGDRLVINLLYISIATIAMYVEKNLLTSCNYDDYIIMDIFVMTFKFASQNAIMLRICEAVLYLLCTVLKMKNKSLNYESWNEILKDCFENETFSMEIRLAAAVGIAEINSIRNLQSTVESKLKLLNYLLKVIVSEKDNEEILGFKKEEVIYSVGSVLKRLSTFSQLILPPNEDIRLEYLNEFFCLVLKRSSDLIKDFISPLLKIISKIQKSFTLQLDKDFMDKFGGKVSFQKRDRFFINCFCNSLNIINAISSSDALQPFLEDICGIIYTSLTTLEEFSHQNIYAVRICEVLLYCLCNIFQSNQMAINYGWIDILSKFYNENKTSKQIKMAAAVSLCYITKISENIEIFLNDVFGKLEKNYLGFSLQEVKDAIQKSRSHTEDKPIETPKTYNALMMTSREDALTLCLKRNKTIYQCLLSNIEESKCFDGSNNSLLHLAAVCLQPELCKFLVKENCSINKVNKEGNNCLQELLLNIDESTVNDKIDHIIETVTVLIESGVDLCHESKDGRNIIQLVSRLNSEKLALTLLTNKTAHIVTKKDFELSFEKKWFENVEKMLNLLSEESLSEFITEEIFLKYLNCTSLKLIRSMFEKSSKKVQELVLEDILYRAANEKDELFDHLIKLMKADLKKLNMKYFTNGETLLTNLIRDKNKTYAFKLIAPKENWKYFDKCNESKQTPLQVAIEMEESDLIDRLLLKSKAINNEDVNGETVLTQLLKKILTCDDNDRETFYTILESMSEKVNLYQITSAKDQKMKNVKEIIKSLDTLPDIIDRISQILINKKCGQCQIESMEYVFLCGHELCSNCSSKTEEYLLEKK